MNRLNKPNEILCYAAIAAAIPLLAKFVEIASGYELSSTIWHITWLICGIALIVVFACLVYIFFAIPIDALLVRISKHKTPHDKDQIQANPEAEPKTTLPKESALQPKDGNSNSEAIIQSAEHAESPTDPLDERHRILQPYINTDEKDKPVAPVLKILDELFKTIRAKKEVGMALYCMYNLKWLASYPSYNDMVAIFGADIIGSKSNYSTYMGPVRDVTDDYGNATSEFLTEVRAMKPKLKRIEERLR